MTVMARWFSRCEISTERDSSKALARKCKSGFVGGLLAALLMALAGDASAQFQTLAVDIVPAAGEFEGDTGTTDIIFPVTLSEPTEAVVTVDYGTVNGTATAGVDYVATSGTLTFNPGETNKFIIVKANGDNDIEPEENFFVNLSSASSSDVTIATVTIANDTGEGLISNDDVASSPPVVSIDPIPVMVTEGNLPSTTEAVFTVRLSAPPSTDVIVNFSTVDGTATAGDDYVATSGTFTFLAGQFNLIRTVSVFVKGDDKDEPDEIFFVELSFPNSPPNSPPIAWGQGTILDDDATPLPLVSVDPAPVMVTEGDIGPTAAVFTVNLSASSTQLVTVDIGTTDGTATAQSDYNAISVTVPFNPGEVSKSVSVAVNGDLLHEPNETFFVELTNATNATIDATKSQGQSIITNDDPIPSVSIDDINVLEGNAGSSTAAVFTLSLSNPSDDLVVVDVFTIDNTATAGSDYTALPAIPSPPTVQFNPGQTSQTVSVYVLGDVLNEAHETFVVNLSSATHATIADNQGVGTIQDDDQVVISIDDVSEVEGNTGTTNANFTVRLLNPTGQSVASEQTITVAYAVNSGTATAGTDYSAASGGTLTFAPGTTSQSIQAGIIGDVIEETDETFSVALSSPTANNVSISSTRGTAIGIILNDDAPALSIDNVSKAEGNAGTTSFDFTVSLSNPTVMYVSVDVALVGGTATTADSDYQATLYAHDPGNSGGPFFPLNTSLTFFPATTTRTLRVEIVGDLVSESNETFLVKLSNPRNATIADSEGHGTIFNDDAPALSIDNVSKVEGNAGTTSFDFTVSLSNPTVMGVSVDVALVDGTATTADSDYQAALYAADPGNPGGPFFPLNTSLEFFPNTTTRTLRVEIVGDLVSETDETFLVKLSNPRNATIAKSEGRGTILNDDDLDGDGISDRIDVQPNTFSNDFSDVALGKKGKTSGTITDRGDQTLTVTEEANPKGVRIEADASGGPKKATISACGGITKASLGSGKSTEVTCGSAIVDVIIGPVEFAFFGDDGRLATGSLNTDNGLTFDQTTFTFTAPSTNTETIVIAFEGQDFLLEPGAEITPQTDPVHHVDCYALLAIHSLHLKQKSKVHSGCVGVNNTGQQPPFVAGKTPLVVDAKAQTAPEVEVSAPSIQIKQKAKVQGTVHYLEELKVAPKATRVLDAVREAADFWPLTQLPPFLQAQPGDKKVEIKKKKTGEIHAQDGPVGQVKVKQKANLIFTGGTYHIHSLEAEPKARIFFQAPTTLLIADKLSLGQKSFFGPMDGSGLDAGDIRVYVAGVNGKLKKRKGRDDDDDGDDDDDDGKFKAGPKAAKVGVQAKCQANIYAPNGTIHLRQKSQSTGAFISRDLILGVQAQVTLLSGWERQGASPSAPPQPAAAKPVRPLAPTEDLSFGVEPNFPNPFNATTTIRYHLAEHSEVKLVIYNILGQQVRQLTDIIQMAGTYTATWDGLDAAGRPVSSGIYLYRLEAQSHAVVGTMLFTK